MFEELNFVKRCFERLEQNLNLIFMLNIRKFVQIPNLR